MRRSLLLVAGAVSAILLVTAPRATAQATTSTPTLGGIPWRHLGPASFGGRIDDIEAVATRPSTIFVGAAGGGVWRSRNNGVTWDATFDAVGASISIGDIAIAPSDPNVVWVGTGEPNNRQSSTWGLGVYRSLDGGTTWQPMGLSDTHHVGRIVIDPHDPDVVFVAALGHLWGPNPERGLYRTRDGGRTWEKVLHVDDDTGVVDVALDADGRTMYAATYQRRRAAYGFVGGGPGSGLWRSLDGGDSWQRLEHGLPGGATGRIGIAIAPSNTDIVYATIENAGGGVFRSEDRGATWTKVSSVTPRPMYYSQIRVDPTNCDKVWMLGTYLMVSIDGGKTFTSEGTAERIHVDHHALWIDPSDPGHMMLGNDGGLHFTWDGGETWDYINNLPIAQFYDVDVDDRDPYWLYGGAQDNGSWATPSRTSKLIGITADDVLNLAYGDGFYATADLASPRYVYASSQNGRAYRVDLETREEKGIRPITSDPDDTLRWSWSTPQLRSPHDPSTVYYGAQRLFRTRDGGASWTSISPDLTRNLDWRSIPLMGVVRDSTTLSRDDGVAAYGTVTTIAESPFAAGTLLVGTDDGNVQMTTDGGGAWRDLTGRFRLPGARWVSRVLFSRHAAGRAFVTFDGHNDDDMTPYVFRTTDGGSTWTSIAGDLPAGTVVRALAEHARNPRLLFAGTEFGLYVTFDGGARWVRAGGNLPRVRVDDVLYDERTDDVVLATHGRGFVVFDDAAFLENGDPAANDRPLTLAPIRPATQTYMQRMLPQPGARTFAAPNPPDGALVTYTLSVSTEAGDSARISVTDAGGRLVRTLAGPGGPGVHRVAWDLRYARVDGVTDADEGWFGPPLGPWVLPGTYTVRVEAGGAAETRTVEVRADPRVDAPRAALEARHAAEMRLQALLGTFVEAARLWDAMSKERQRIADSAADSASTAALSGALDTVRTALDSLGSRFRPGFGGPKFRFLDLDGALQASSSAPTQSQMNELQALAASLTTDVAALNAVLSGPFAELERRAASSGATGLSPVRPPGGGSRR